MPYRLIAVFALTALSLIAACADQQSGEPSARWQVRGEFSHGDATTRYVATYQDTILVAVEEEQNYGDYGLARTRYEVVDGRLVYYRSDEQRRVMSEGQTGDFEEISLELEFDEAGRIRRQIKLVDGEPTELVGYEAPGVQRHFEELKRRADLAQGAALGGM